MKIITTAVNSPEFIEIQHSTLMKYIKTDYEFVVFNDAKGWPDYSNWGDAGIREKISRKCTELGVRCIEIPNESHWHNKNSSTRAADTLNYMHHQLIRNKEKCLVIDSDMFLVNTFDHEKYFQFHCAVVLQERGKIKYPWNGIFYFDYTKMEKLERIDWNVKRHCDTGGKNEKWLRSIARQFPSCKDLRYSPEEFHTDKVYFIKHLWSLSWDESEMPVKNDALLTLLKTDPRNVDHKFFFEIYDKKFLHYRAGGNWMKQNKAMHTSITRQLMEILL